MHHKTALFLSQTADGHERMRRISSMLDVSVLLAGIARFDQAVLEREFDLVVLDINGVSSSQVEHVETILADSSTPILFVVTESLMSDLHLPMRPVSDFVNSQAVDVEFAARMRHLLWPGEETGDEDVIKIAELSVNLATYQVRVDDKPIDLTYMEYSLLAFMVTHPGRAYTREALLRRVWGFEYCGGSRTVDVHVRRIRAKLGAQASSHIETVRGVGYLFKL
ncbi:MAG: response regulator transcription factor [Coriobacteriales bacterium]|nr:response regulator transcription factor [Coriobacteriales bacterium]